MLASAGFACLGMRMSQPVSPCTGVCKIDKTSGWCSGCLRSLGEIAHGISSNLLTRAADVVLKERRKLVLLVRETPLHAIHLRNMATLAEIGAIIAPPVPAFYNRPETLDDVIDHTVGRVLDLFDLDTGRVKRWS